MTKTAEFDSVRDALADTPEQTANLRAQTELMRQISATIQSKGRKQAEAAEHAGVTQPRINDILRGHLSRFCLDALVNITTTLDRRVHLEVDTA